MKKNEASPCWTLRLQHTSLPKSLSRCRVGWVLHRTTMTSSDQRALAQPRTLPSLLEHYPKVVGGTVCNLKACPLQKFYNPVIFFKMFWVVFVRHDWLPHCHKNQNTLISKTEKKICGIQFEFVFTEWKVPTAQMHVAFPWMSLGGTPQAKQEWIHTGTCMVTMPTFTPAKWGDRPTCPSAD